MDAAQAKIFVEDLLGKSIGGWEALSHLGSGKSAVVLRARRGEENAALKVFHPELVERHGKSTQIERISREKGLIGATHPHLVKIVDGGECDLTGHLFIVMELLPCSNLKSVIGKVPVESIPILISQVASAARFLEDRNLAHRDIKPENIAVSDDFSHAILLDLGVLRPVGSSNLTDADQRPFIGTLRYSSPEFLSRKEEDSQAGWRAVTFYQLGAVLHDMLMRRELFHEDSEPFADLVEAVLRKVPEIHAEDVRCVALANHCLLKRPASRLELVTWARFSALAEPDAKTSILTRERIRDRQKYFLAAADGARTQPAFRLDRKSLDEVCNRVETRVAVLMNELQAFPLKMTQSEQNLSEGLSRTCINFEPDIAKGLPHRIFVALTLTFLDEHSGSLLFKIDAAAMMAHAADPMPIDLPGVQVYAGELGTFLDGKEFESIFLSALDSAYVIIEQGKEPVLGQGITLSVSEAFQ